MKIYFGLFVLVILLAAAGGCTTQQEKPAATAATLTTAVPATEVTEITATPSPKPTPEKITTTIAAAEVTAALATTMATPRPTNTWSVKYLTIHIRNNTYVPDELTVVPGAGVTWINDDSVIHIVKAAGESRGKFTSAEMMNGASFHYTFGEKTGTFEFGDPNYPEMKGAVIVKKGATLVGDSPTLSP